MRSIYTVGHSNRSLQDLLTLLKGNGITAVADVRSQPFSRLHPQFNKNALRDFLYGHNIAYAFLGEELGARSHDPACYENGKVSYDLLSQTALFQHGLDRIENGIRKGYVIALVCAERDPVICHRAILISRYLVEREIAVEHILNDFTLESHTATLNRLMKMLSLESRHMFKPDSELIKIAYQIQGERIAYSRETHGEGEVGK